MPHVFVALVHHPVRGRDGSIITTSITNLDIHDIARTARTYDIERYFVVTPIEAQRALVDHILGYWLHGDGGRRVPERAEALSRVTAVPTLAHALQSLGGDPIVCTTAARSGFPITTCAEARTLFVATPERPVLLLFGTGYGLADEVIARAQVHLAPVRPGGAYNHLAVRSAVAIVLDRLFGDAGAGASNG